MNDRPNKIIGILAGMGPKSTAPFIDAVVHECQAQYGAQYDIDFPEMMILSLPTPFYVDRPIEHDSMKAVIISGLKKLVASRVSFIAIPCNSAHVYFDDLRRAISVPLLNIIDETLATIPARTRITLFATRTTFDAGIYQSGISGRGSEFIFDASWQPRIDRTITSIKSGDLTAARSEWTGLIELVKEQGIQNIISACTDLNVVSSPDKSVAFVDSSKVLAGAVVREYLKK